MANKTTGKVVMSKEERHIATMLNQVELEYQQLDKLSDEKLEQYETVLNKELDIQTMRLSVINLQLGVEISSKNHAMVSTNSSEYIEIEHKYDSRSEDVVTKAGKTITKTYYYSHHGIDAKGIKKKDVGSDQYEVITQSREDLRGRRDKIQAAIKRLKSTKSNISAVRHNRKAKTLKVSIEKRGKVTQSIKQIAEAYFPKKYTPLSDEQAQAQAQTA